MKSIAFPDTTKQIEDCIYRLDDACYQTLNNFYPNKCNDCCARELDQLLHKKFPSMKENDIVAIVTELTRHDSYIQPIHA
jgi:hypothetical protein